MIPVALPSLSFVLMVVFLLGTTLLWLIWTLSLALKSAQTRLPTRWSKALYTLISCISLWTLYQLLDFKWQMDAYKAQLQAEFAPTLQVATHLGGIGMPAGTQLTLMIANTPESFRKAQFPFPIQIASISATQIERHIAIQTDAKHHTSGFQTESMRITGQGVTLQEGWRCDASEPVEFDLQSDGGIAAFKRCTLAAGNRAADIELPKGTAVWRTTGNTYTDGFVDDDHWSLDIPANEVVAITGLPLHSPLIRLTAQRQLHEVSRATLAQTAQFAGQSYPAGAQASFNARSERALRPLQWRIVASP